jgi:hypothetical protein
MCTLMIFLTLWGVVLNLSDVFKISCAFLSIIRSSSVSKLASSHSVVIESNEIHGPDNDSIKLWVKNVTYKVRSII